MPSSATRQWLDKASEDEAVAALLRTHGGPWSVAAYHVQQAAEKSVKAALVEAGVAPPKTHDLQQLLGLHPGAAAGPLVQQAAAMVGA
jgi:HEPN domain-containing protein